MARRVDNIDARLVPNHRGRFGENGDAALFFQIAAIHQPFIDRLIVAKQAGLLQNRVNERGFAVVNMGDNGNIAKIFCRGEGHERAFSILGSGLMRKLQKKWCPGAGSNHRHADFQSAALPTELPGHMAALQPPLSEAFIGHAFAAVQPPQRL